MTHPKDKLNNAKDKIIGEAKDKIGKVTGNEELELEGKVQSLKSDINTKHEDIKDDVTKKINNLFDGKKGKK